MNWAEIKGSIRDALGKFLYEQTKRKPVILPVVMEARQPQDLNKRYTKKIIIKIKVTKSPFFV
ncbi:Ribonuclease J 2 [Lactococcus lactis]|nr:Ribonuclease J 2 [Lactococcus lactis]